MYELKIKEKRKLKGLTQKQLAFKIERSQNFLSELENGRYEISVSLLCKIGEALDLCPHSLLEYSCPINCAIYCTYNKNKG